MGGPPERWHRFCQEQVARRKLQRCRALLAATHQSHLDGEIGEGELRARMLRALDAEEEAEETSSNDSVLGKGKGKGGKGDGMRCGACGSLLYIPFTPGADMPKGGKGQGGQRVMYDSDEWHALQELRYREAEAKGQAKGGKSAAEILLGGLEPGPREERSRSPQPAWVAALAGGDRMPVTPPVTPPE